MPVNSEDLTVNAEDLFCYILIYTHNQAWLVIGLVALSVPLVCLGGYKLWQLRGTRNRATVVVYSLLFAWWLSTHLPSLAFLATESYSLWLYHLHDLNHNDPSNSEMSVKSEYLFLVDWMSTYALQLVMLYVPYRWYL